MAIHISPQAPKVWSYLLKKFNNNEYGVAGIMGNMYAESIIYSNRKQNDNAIPPGSASTSYTSGINNKTISKNTFVNDGVGYGLVQFTFWTLKEQLYNATVAKGIDVSDYKVQIKTMRNQMTSSLIQAIEDATEIETPTKKFLHEYENPAEQGPSVEQLRISYATEIYTHFHGTPPVPTSDFPIWLLYKYKKGRY